MRTFTCSALAAGFLLTLSGCAPNEIAGHGTSRSGTFVQKLGVSGHDNMVTVDRDSSLDKISIMGDNNTVQVEEGATLAKVEIFGNDNTISLPEGLLVRFNEMGRGNKVIYRPPSWKAGEPMSPEAFREPSAPFNPPAREAAPSAGEPAREPQIP
jgi:hypothetical protein